MTTNDTRAAATGHVGEESAGTADERQAADQLSLGRRLRQPRTLISLILPLVLVVLIFRVALNIDFGKLVDGIRQADLRLLLAAFLIFYAGFPIRGYRWRRLLRGARFDLATRDATEILFLSWLVNCLVPAKLGDVYRAYLLKINSHASLSRTFGTVFLERVLDLFAIASLGLVAGFWSFRNGFPPEMQFVFSLGVVVLVGLAVAMLTMRNFGRQILIKLPLPRRERILNLYDRFEEGVFGAIGLRALPALGALTILIWATESLRLYLVVQALHLPGVELGLSGAVFVALIGSLLTAVPLTPAGIGTVELGVSFVLTLAYNVPQTEAATIVVLDRLISVFSIIVLGGIAYVVSPIRRGKREVGHDLDEPSPA